MSTSRPKRKATEISIPDTGPERKRLLNVLAQRRYRQRKNDRLRELEAQAKNRDSLPSSDIPSSHEDIDSIINDALSALPPALQDLPADQLSPSLAPPSPPSSTEFDFYLPPFAPSTEPGLSSFPAAGTISDHLQTHQSSTFTFPDDHTLQVPSLTLLNAAMKVALRLNIVDNIWDLSASSPFYMNGDLSSSSSATQLDLSLLPVHLQPTRTQRFIPHHPLLDLLPWPATRDKLIQVFSLPAEVRPKAAQDPMGMVRLVYDMEDPSGEGMRVTGEDPLEAMGWEIGQILFERWWWAFEVAVVEGSNSRRRRRGENGLTL